ncbi:MAG: hypothetical protein ACUVX8_05175 [Candidatus Zipacnadales bacterium]
MATEVASVRRGRYRATRQTRRFVGWTVLALLFAPLVLQRFVPNETVQGVLAAGTLFVAGYLALAYVLVARARVRLFAAALVCAAVFGISAIPYVIGGWWRSVSPGYLLGLLQYATYPLILGVLLPAFLTGREIMRMSCVIIALQGVIIAVITLPTLFGGNPLIAIYRFNTGVDPVAIQLGGLGLATLAIIGREGGQPSTVQRQRQAIIIGTAVVLIGITLPTFARTATISLLSALFIMAVLRGLGRRIAALLTHAAVLAAVVFPTLVWMGVITETNIRVLDTIIPNKRERDVTPESTLVNRIKKEKIFLSAMTYRDFIGSRRELHDYERYQEQGVGKNLAFAHNYWVHMMLTIGYGGCLILWLLWHYMVYEAARSHEPANHWALCWFMFFTVSGTMTFGAFRGLPALAFWCIGGAVLASLRWGVPVRKHSVESLVATAPAQTA